MAFGRLQKVAPRRSAYLLALAFVLVAINGYFTVRSAHTTIRDQALVAHTQEVLKNLHQLLAQLRDAENGELGFAFTAQEHFLDPYSRSLALIDAQVTSLRQL